MYMKKINWFVCFWLIGIFTLQSQNLALHIDGKDNNVRTGIGFLQAPWTLEAWIKGDDTSWKETEVIFGGGEYSTFSQADNYPLVVKEGKLYSMQARLGSDHWLDDKWHHVALVCDEFIRGWRFGSQPGYGGHHHTGSHWRERDE